MVKNTPQRKAARSWKTQEFGGAEIGQPTQRMLEAELYALAITEPNPKDPKYNKWDSEWKKTYSQYLKLYPKSNWLKSFTSWALTKRSKQ